jgi:hypothetical protein
MDDYYTLETFYRRSNGLSQLDPVQPKSTSALFSGGFGVEE